MSPFFIYSKKILFFQYFSFIIFLPIISALYFSYPTSINLKTGKILIIHENGIDICDSEFTTSTNIYTFSDEEKISDLEKLSKISIIKFEDGFIISLIINKLYFFDTNGTFLERTESLNTNDLVYTLAPQNIDYYNYYYIVGYIYQESLYLSYYEYDPYQELGYRNTRLGYLERFNKGNTDNSFTIINKGLSCEVLEKYSCRDYIVCAYYCMN